MGPLISAQNALQKVLEARSRPYDPNVNASFLDSVQRKSLIFLLPATPCASAMLFPNNTIPQLNLAEGRGAEFTLPRPDSSGRGRGSIANRGTSRQSRYRLIAGPE